MFRNIFTINATQFKPGQQNMWLIDLLLFKISWVVLVFFQDQAIVPAVGIILLKVFFWPEITRSLATIVTTLVLGMGMDFFLTVTGIFIFPEYKLPFWLVLLWLSFAMTLPRGFSFVSKLPPLLQACVGMLAGIVGYFFGYLLGAVAFGYSVSMSLLIVGLLWSGFIPLLLWLEQNTLPDAKGAS